MTPAVFLAALALAQPPVGPLSPADLPPPPRPTPPPLAADPPAVTRAQAGVLLTGTFETALHVWQCPDAPDTARRKLVAALAAYGGFWHAGVTPDGAVEGTMTEGRVVALALPATTGSTVLLFATFPEKELPDVIARAVERAYRGVGGATGPERVGKRNPDLDQLLPTTTWHAETRRRPAVAKPFARTADELLARDEYNALPLWEDADAGISLQSGRSRDRTRCLLFLTVPGPAGGTHHVTLALTGPGVPPSRPAREAGESLVRLLYD